MFNRSVRILKLFLLSIMLFMLATCTQKPAPASPEIAQDPDPLRFSELVAHYVQLDSLNAPSDSVVLFVGSSSIQGWKSLEQDLAEYDALNRGMGGSHMSDLIYYLDQIVFTHKPTAIFVYEGDNDIAWGKSPERVFQDYLTFVNKVRERWPEVPVYFISIKPSLARVEYLANMAAANTLIKGYTEQSKTLYYVDVFTPMLGADGLPRPGIFGHDGLHMNADGYSIWIDQIKKAMMDE